MLIGEELRSDFEIEKNLIKLLYIIKHDFYQDGEFFNKHFINISPFENDAFILTLYCRWNSLFNANKNNETKLKYFLNNSTIFNEFLESYSKLILEAKGKSFDYEIKVFTETFKIFKEVSLYNRKDFQEVIYNGWQASIILLVKGLGELKERKEKIKLLRFIQRVNKDYEELGEAEISRIRNKYSTWHFPEDDDSDIFDKYFIIAQSRNSGGFIKMSEYSHLTFSLIDAYILDNKLVFLFLLDNFFNGDYEKYLNLHKDLSNYFINSSEERWKMGFPYSLSLRISSRNIMDNYIDNAPFEWWITLAEKN